MKYHCWSIPYTATGSDVCISRTLLDFHTGKTALTGSRRVTLPFEVEKFWETCGMDEVIDPLNVAIFDTM